MNLQDNHFALFGLPERFDLDVDALDRTWRDVQAQVHPDRFARASAAEQRVALQWATRVNEAHRVLRDALSRAIYLCTLRGQDPADEHDTSMPQAFLMQQLEWREALAEARATVDAAAIDDLHDQLEARRRLLRAEVAQALDVDQDAPRAAARVREWMFVERFGADVRAAQSDVPQAAAH